MDLLSSCLSSPVSDEHELPPIENEKPVESVRTLKRSVRSNRNTMKFGSAALRNNNNNVKKSE